MAAVVTKPIGVPRKMPNIGAGRDRGTNICGVNAFAHRIQGYSMTEPLKAPYPYPGGKSDAAPEIWRRFGDVPNYVEGCAGSAAVFFARPHNLDGKTETLNDLDGFITNALRAIAYAPEETAAWCDWPVSECDLTARHLWLKAQRDDLTARLFADPLYCDPQAAGWWLWGIASWIGDGWCVADGPWINVGGRLVDRRTLPADEQDQEGVSKRMPEVGLGPNSEYGFNRKGVRAYLHRAAPGVPRQMPHVGGDKKGCKVVHGINRADVVPPGALLAYFDRLALRLRRVRLLCGDWQRAVKDSITVNHGLTGLLLDPPYPQAEHSMGYHGDNDIWWDVARWAVEHGADPRLRICVCGYVSEATDAIFPPSWTRVAWQARGGYSNQAKDGRGRSNARREMLWFSPFCIDPANDWAGTLFEVAE